MQTIQINYSKRAISSFCKKWNVIEFSFFGSVLSEEFKPESDIDIMVSFSEGSEIGLFELAEMQSELEKIFKRHVDIVEKEALQNPYRKHQIMESAKVVYET